MAPSMPAPLAFDDIAIDFAGRRLLRGGIEQPLEPKAFAVLALLAGAPGRVFARDEILDAVWGHRHVTPGVLNRVMTLLRHALGEDAQGARYLHTVHGVGYRFDLPEREPEVSTPSIPTSAAETESRPASPPMRRANDGRRTSPRWILWLPLLALLAFAGWRWWPRTPSASTLVPVTARSIAVLPLVNASRDPDQRFFSDGLSESLINALSRFGGLRVIGRDSAFQFRDGKDDSRSIGRKLGVSYLLSGSVQHVGDVVRINAALTKAADGSTLWAEHYDRPYKDLFALQDEIASSVAVALQARLVSTNRPATHDDRPPSGNLEAYDAYLQGLKDWHELDFPKAAEHLARAVQLDPDYAVAWADLSGSWSTTATFLDSDPDAAREHMQQARLAADRALQLESGLGSAHAARAYLQFYGFDHRDALAECRRAVRLAPDNGMVLNGCGHVLAGLGKLGEALRLRERLISIEPLYSANYFEYEKLLEATGRLDEAGKYLRIAEGLSQPTTHERLIAALLRGDGETARDIAASAPANNRTLYMAQAMQIGPDRAAADAALANALQEQTPAEFGPYRMAQLYAMREDAGSAVEWLERTPSPYRLFLLADPLIMNMRDDPRFIAFCEKTGLPLPSESDTLSIDQIRASFAAKG